MPPGKRRKIDTDHRRAHEDTEPDSHTPKRRRKDLLHSSKEYWATAAIVSENVPKRQFLIRWKGRDRDGSLWEDSWVSFHSTSPWQPGDTSMFLNASAKSRLFCCSRSRTKTSFRKLSKSGRLGRRLTDPSTNVRTLTLRNYLIRMAGI